jgi:hypothetical protein
VQLDRLESFFSANPAARLLRSPHAAPIAHFLNLQFKKSGDITIGHAELVQRLGEYLNELHVTEPNCLVDRPESYLNDWTSAEVRWLRRYHDADYAEPVYELTPHSEAVLKFLDQALQRSAGFIGTESRLKRIIDTLSDLVVRSSSDPEARLRYLRAERRKLDEEIAAIESGTGVATYSATAIRERFADAVNDLSDLQGDFRAVEESFKEITRDVQRQQSDAALGRGAILGFALAAEDRLKTADQGVSFDEFVRLILSPSRQEQLEAIVERLQGLDALAEQSHGMDRVRGMISHLADEAEKVLRTTRRLSATLRRLLDLGSSSSRQQLATVLGDIKSLARQLGDSSGAQDFGLSLTTELELHAPMERTFWMAPATFDVGELVQHAPDELDRFAAFRNFAALERLDWGRMRDSIRSVLAHSRGDVALVDLLAKHPATNGAVELMGYLQLAHDEGHEVSAHETQLVKVAGVDGVEIAYEMPVVVFRKQPAGQVVGTGARL